MSINSLSESNNSVTISNRALETNAQREQRFLNGLSVILIGAYCLAIVLFSLIALLSSQVVAWILTSILGLGLGLAVLSYRLSRHLTTVRLGSWIIVGYTISIITIFLYVLGSEQPISTAYLIPLTISLFLLTWRTTLSLMLAALVAIFILYFLESNGYQALLPLGRVEATYLVLGVWTIAIVTPILLCFFMVRQIKQAFDLAVEQTQQLNQALMSIEDKRQYGELVSNRIVSVTAELNATAGQQATGSQQQAVALNESIISLEELAQTAQVVASNADIIDHQMQKTLLSTQDVKATSEAVAQTGERGRQVVANTFGSSQHVSSLYQTLVQNLTTLEERSNQIKGIIELLRALSDETHLLALNAAIEAAGAGEYGIRFRVVANEVKNLANRSIVSSREVGAILYEVQEGIKQAVLTAQNGQNETEAAVKMAQESGVVINDLASAVASSAQEVSKIAEGIKAISELTRQINHAAGEQHSASQQAVERLIQVGMVAHQNASGSVQLSNTANSLEELSQGLTTALSA